MNHDHNQHVIQYVVYVMLHILIVYVNQVMDHLVQILLEYQIQVDDKLKRNWKKKKRINKEADAL